MYDFPHPRSPFRCFTIINPGCQASFPRVLSLFKIRTQCSDTTLSFVRAVLGTDETLDCWLQAPDICDLSRNLTSRCCKPSETRTCLQRGFLQKSLNVFKAASWGSACPSLHAMSRTLNEIKQWQLYLYGIIFAPQSSHRKRLHHPQRPRKKQQNLPFVIESWGISVRFVAGVCPCDSRRQEPIKMGSCRRLWQSKRAFLRVIFPSICWPTWPRSRWLDDSPAVAGFYWKP